MRCRKLLEYPFSTGLIMNDKDGAQLRSVFREDHPLAVSGIPVLCQQVLIFSTEMYFLGRGI